MSSFLFFRDNIFSHFPNRCKYFNGYTRINLVQHYFDVYSNTVLHTYLRSPTSTGRCGKGHWANVSQTNSECKYQIPYYDQFNAIDETELRTSV